MLIVDFKSCPHPPGTMLPSADRSLGSGVGTAFPIRRADKIVMVRVRALNSFMS